MPEARTAYRIGESLGIPPGTLQPMMRTLLGMGFVERLDDPQIRELGAGRQTVARPYVITPEAAPGITTYFEEKALRILQGLRALNPGRRI